MGDPKVGELVTKIQKKESKVGKVWRSARFGQDECTKPEQDAVLAGAGGEVKFVKCVDDITGNQLPWQALKQAREQELKYLRGLGVYEKVDEHAAVAKYNVTPIDTTWVDTDKAFEGEEPMQILSRIVAREFKSGDRPDLYAGTLALEALRAVTSEAASHIPEFSLMPVDVSRAYSHAKAHGLVLVKLAAEGYSGRVKGQMGLLNKGMHGTRDAASNWERDWQGHLENWGYELGRSSSNFVHNKKRKTSGLTDGDDFVVTGSKESLLEPKNQLESVYPIKASTIGAGFGKEYQGAESENTLGRDRDMVPARSPTR